MVSDVSVQYRIEESSKNMKILGKLSKNFKKMEKMFLKNFIWNIVLDEPWIFYSYQIFKILEKQGLNVDLKFKDY